jgi:hypothetical protein
LHFQGFDLQRGARLAQHSRSEGNDGRSRRFHAFIPKPVRLKAFDKIPAAALLVAVRDVAGAHPSHPVTQMLADPRPS